jgi:predicted Zn-dependent protease
MQRLGVLRPADQENWLQLVEAALRSQNTTVARAASRRLLVPNAEPPMIASVLDLWIDYWPSPERVAEARTLARAAAGVGQRVAYASFLSRVGSAADAVSLIGGAASLPVTANNAEANAVLADAWSRLGKLADAKSRFDAVLAFDPGNATALRGRSELALRTGHAQAAVLDAQKLVTVLPQSPGDRLLLARCFTAAGNSSWAQRTLWAAFKEIPGDEKIFAALRGTKNGDSEATTELDEEFGRQREQKLARGLI